MRAILFDASAVVSWYLDQSPRVKEPRSRILRLKKDHGCILYVPNICIPEVLNAFARRRYESDKSGNRLTLTEYSEYLNRFERDIHWGRLFYPYDLNRYHIVATDEIIPFEYEVKRESRMDKDKRYDRLSGFDILVIAMAAELAYVHGPEQSLLVTGDNRMKLVCDAIRGAPTKERAHRRRSLFTDVPDGRWPAPSCFDIWNDDPQRISQVIIGKPVNGLRA